RCRRLQPDQRDHPPAALEIMLGGEDARHLGRFLDERVPLGAVGALPLPAVRHRPAGLANIARFDLGHSQSSPERGGGPRREASWWRGRLAQVVRTYVITPSRLLRTSRAAIRSV